MICHICKNKLIAVPNTKYYCKVCKLLVFNLYNWRIHKDDMIISSSSNDTVLYYKDKEIKLGQSSILPQNKDELLNLISKIKSLMIFS